MCAQFAISSETYVCVFLCTLLFVCFFLSFFLITFGFLLPLNPLNSQIEDGWWMGKKNGKIGAFPSNFVKEVFVTPKGKKGQS